MEEKIQAKITGLVEYIISKPNEAITLDDYTILAAEVKDARFRREQAEQGDRFNKLLAAVIPSFNGPEVKPVAKTGEAKA